MDHHEQHHQHHEKEREEQLRHAKHHHGGNETAMWMFHPAWFVVLGTVLLLMVVFTWIFMVP